jgi:hypothetical protein
MLRLTGMTQPRALFSLFDDTIDTRAEANTAEKLLEQDPLDLGTRAQLLHYYYNLEITSGCTDVGQKRLHHMSWFIKHQPDLEFCGTALFYIRSSDEQFQKINKLWGEALNLSPAIMRRINASMYIANADEAKGLEELNSLLSGSNNIWVLALRDLLSGSSSSFLSEVALESSKPLTVDENYRAKLSAELNRTKDWNTVALANDIELERSTLGTDKFDSTMSLAMVADIAGWSVFRFESNSILGFNPEMLTTRFNLACWVIRHLPSSDLANSPIFIGPFDSPQSYDLFTRKKPASLEPLVTFVGGLWAGQLRAFPDDKHIAKNAAKFVVGTQPYLSEAAQIVVSHLDKTSIGREVLRKSRGS